MNLLNTILLVMELRNCNISRENSDNGLMKLRNFLMMIVIKRKRLLMLDLDLNWITGEAECRKSPISVNNSRAEISNKLRTIFSDTNNTTQDQENNSKSMKIFQNSLLNITDLIYC